LTLIGAVNSVIFDTEFFLDLPLQKSPSRAFLRFIRATGVRMSLRSAM
jgi:hypothetical protein